MRNKTIFKKALSVLIALMLIALSVPVAASAQGAAAISFTGSYDSDSNIVTVDVTVSDVDSMAAYFFALTYDTEGFDLCDASGNILTDGSTNIFVNGTLPGSTLMPLASVLRTEHGNIGQAGMLLPAYVPSGSGAKIATFYLKAKSAEAAYEMAANGGGVSLCTDPDFVELLSTGVDGATGAGVITNDYDQFLTMDGTLAGGINMNLPQPVIESFVQAQVTTVEGVAPVLPEKVTANFTGGLTELRDVTWDTVSPEAYAAVGEFYVNGTVEGTAVRPVCKVTVTGKTISSVAPSASISTPAGVDPTENLPQNVTVTYDNATTAELPVEWDDIAESSYAESGASFTVEGTVQGTELKASIQITVTAPVAVGFEDSFANTVVGVDPTSKLPAKVTVNYSDGSSMELDVAWDAVPADKYAAVGSFTVEGTVSGISLKPSCKITVVDKQIITVEEVAVSTPAGVAPQLPAQTGVTYDNSTTGTAAVSWPRIDESSYAAAGSSFRVEGTVEGSDIKCVATVTVTAPVIASLNDAQIKTVIGVDPTANLPANVTAVMSDGSTELIAASWAAISPESYAAVGSFTVEGTVSGTELKAKCIVTVVDRSIISLVAPSPISTPAGIDPTASLPAEVTANYDNGTTANVAVTWDTIASASYAKKGTSFTVEGTVSGTDKKAQCTVNVTDPIIVSLNAAQIQTVVGVNPTANLPAEITAVMSDGSNESRAVASWDPILPINYATVGAFDVEGTVSGTELKAKCTVTVVDRSIISLVAPSSISTPAGINPTALLPAEVTANYDNGTTANVAVAWDTIDAASYAEKDTSFIVEGTVSGTELKAQCTVNVTDPVITSIPVWSVSTKAGIAPVMPDAVTANYSDGTQSSVSVTWASIDPSEYATSGVTFEVTGTVAGTDKTAVCAVTVLDAEIVSLADTSATTPAGIAPKLPATVTATMSNGTTCQVSVVWDTDYTEDDYSEQGNTFTVTGSVSGFNGTVSCEVTVTAAVIISFDPIELATPAGIVPVLPAVATANYSDGTSKDISVSWQNNDRSRYMTPGQSVTVFGIADGTAIGVPATVTVTSPLVTALTDGEVSTAIGVVPALPESVEALFSNDTVGSVEVYWDRVTAADVSSVGDVSVTGSIDDAYGYDDDAVCVIHVKDAVVTGFSVPASAPAEGGDVTVSVLGSYLRDGIFEVKAYDGETEIASVDAAGTQNSLSAVISIPANTAHAGKAYTFKLFKNGVEMADIAPTVLTVAALADTLSVSPAVLNLPVEAGENQITVSSNYTWKVAGISADWITVSAQDLDGDGVMSISVAENTGAARIGTVTLKSDGELAAEATVTINQAGVRDPYNVPAVFDAKHAVTVSGQIHEDAVLVVNDISPDSDAYKAIAQYAGDGSIGLCYDVHFELAGQIVPHRGNVTVTFGVNDKYNGATWTVLHMKSDGTVESFKSVVTNGTVSATVDGLSTFAVVVAPEVKGDVAVPTGDSVPMLPVVVLMLSAAAMMYLSLSMKKRGAAPAVLENAANAMQKAWNRYSDICRGK